MIRIWFSQLPARVVMMFIYGYKVALSPFFAGSCRFVPSCSTYALEAVAHHGALRGSWLTTKRLLRCHPFCSGGLDQVPTTPESPVVPPR